VAEWREEAIGRHHDRKGFDCGVPELNEYFRRYARQNHETGGAKTFVVVRPNLPAEIVGYYSITPGAVDFARVPPGTIRGLGRYAIPVFLLARLAIGVSEQGKGLGGKLFLTAAARAITVAGEAGGVALAIEAKNPAATAWYQRFGAVSLVDDPLTLILPFGVAAAAIEAASR
jgi:GNAT superfamily N-acetyltransferase